MSRYNQAMWPKAIAQLVELLPHMARLLPMADRFLQAKTSDTEASRNALEQMASGLRGDLGQVTASHAGFYRALSEQSEKLSAIGAEIRATDASLQAVAQRLIAVERFVRLVFLLVVMFLPLTSVLVFGLLIYRH